MKRNIILFLVAIILSATAFPQKVEAAATMAGSSAVLAQNIQLSQEEEVDRRAETLRAYLESYDSPLAEYADVFVEEADKNDLDWRLVAAIAGVESYYGQMIPPNSYNGWGFGVYGDNVLRFNSWEDGIATVSEALRENYMDKWGATNIAEIGDIYAADPHWANKVTHFIEDINNSYDSERNNTLPISL